HRRRLPRGVRAVLPGTEEMTDFPRVRTYKRKSRKLAACCGRGDNPVLREIRTFVIPRQLALLDQSRC
ncbi:MAG: hypothetical protein L0Y71_04855, partial [Gemmataceae bacterium]|nr:hypothetical protein [Gemmataceae bacterium]